MTVSASSCDAPSHLQHHSSCVASLPPDSKIAEASLQKIMKIQKSGKKKIKLNSTIFLLWKLVHILQQIPLVFFLFQVYNLVTGGSNLTILHLICFSELTVCPYSHIIQYFSRGGMVRVRSLWRNHAVLALACIPSTSIRRLEGTREEGLIGSQQEKGHAVQRVQGWRNCPVPNLDFSQEGGEREGTAARENPQSLRSRQPQCPSRIEQSCLERGEIWGSGPPPPLQPPKLFTCPLHKRMYQRVTRLSTE